MTSIKSSVCIIIFALLFFCIDHFLSLTLSVPCELLIPENIDPNGFLQVTFLRLTEVLILVLLYKKDILSMVGISDYFKFFFDVVIGLGIAILGFALFMSMHHLGLNLLPPQTLEQSKGTFNTQQFIFFVISGGCIAPFVEELFFRGCLINLIDKKGAFSRRLPNYILAGLIFVIPHISFQSETGNLWQTLSDQKDYIAIWSFCALLTTGLYLWRRSILTGWIVHCLANITLYSIETKVLLPLL